MTYAVFPTLVGQGIEVHKRPRFDTAVSIHAAGNEARARRYLWPLFDFELTFTALDATATGSYGAVGAASLQTLAGFFLSQQGQYQAFLYVDPSDNSVTAQPIGTGDGSTTSFTFVRPIGPFIGPADVVTGVSSVTLSGVAASGWSQSGDNGLSFASAPGAGVAIAASFTFAYRVRFAADVADFEEFMALLMELKTVKLAGVRGLPSSTALATYVVIIDDPSVTEWQTPAGLLSCPAINGIAGGGGGYSGIYEGAGSAGGGGAYVPLPNPTITPGAVYPISIGPGGAGGTPTNVYTYSGAPGGNTTFGSILVAAQGLSGSGGQASGCTPTLGAQSGGNGGGAPYAWPGSGGAGGGGGGAGGPHGPGANGANAVVGASPGGGGGGADGGGAGSLPGGGAAQNGAAGGAAGAAGSTGSGGGGGQGGAGGAGAFLWFASSGAAGGPGGGGGGGDMGANAFVGGAGGLWGGGGGQGGSGGYSGVSGAGGAGARGALIIIYTAAA